MATALNMLAAQSAHLSSTESPRTPPAIRSSLAPYPQRAAVYVPLPLTPRESTHPLLRGALRRGKWTQEEERYAAAVIQYFVKGVLPVQYGTTLRGYLAELLHCDPMRVSKKLVPGSVFVDIRVDPKIGRRSFYPCPADAPGLERRKAQAEQHLTEMRALFIDSIEREEEEAHPQPADDHIDRMPQQVLPSLAELLRDNRLRSPTHLTPIESHGHDRPMNGYYASVPVEETRYPSPLRAHHHPSHYSNMHLQPPYQSYT